MTHTQSHRPIRIALSLLTAALAFALAPAAQAKEVVDVFGFPGPEGGHLNYPTGIAINQTGAGGVPPGTLYVGEEFEPHEERVGTDANRIQRLDPEGNFERLWGLDVVGPNEKQEVAISFGELREFGGSFSLTFGADTAEFTLSATPYHGGLQFTPTREEIQSGLEALPSIGAGNVLVAGGPVFPKKKIAFEVEFVGALGGTNVDQLVIDGSQIVGPPPISASVSTLKDGSGGPFAGFEICTVASECKQGDASRKTANGGQVSLPGDIVVNQSSGDVYVLDRGNRISEFDADGNFLRAFGRDVVAGGGVGDLGTNAYEICTVASDCKNGVPSESGGAISYGSLAIDSSGHLWFSDATNRRLEEFEANGGFIAAYGWDVEAPGSSSPATEVSATPLASTAAGVAVDGSTGNFYTTRAGSAKVEVFGADQPGPGHHFLEIFGSANEPSFIQPLGMAVDQSTGDLLVIDREANTISRWNPDGSAAEFSALGSNVIDGKGGADTTPQGRISFESFSSASQVQIAVDNSGGVADGDIYVTQTDTGTFSRALPRVVDIFASSGAYLGQLTASSEGEIRFPCGVAVDPTGNVYVSDYYGLRIHKFVPAANPPVNGDNSANFAVGAGDCTIAAGAAATDGFIFPARANGVHEGLVVKLDATNGAEEYAVDAGPTTTLSVDPSSGHLYTATGSEIAEFDAPPGSSGGVEKCTSTAIGACQAGTEGGALGKFGEGGPGRMTVDAAGFVYALDTENNRIERFDPATLTVTQFAPNLAAEAGPSRIANYGGGIQALPNGHFLLGVPISQGANRLLDLDASGQLSETSLVGSSLADFAVSESSGAIYATVGRGVPGVAIIDDGPASAPTVSIEAPSGLEVEAATLNATVDPLGVPVAGCRFEYSIDQINWEAVAERPDCASLDPEGGPQPLSAKLEGLEPESSYHVRLKAGRFYNAAKTATSGEAELTTPAAPPILTDVGAARVTDASAYLAGEVRSLSQASFEYHFEYGTSEALGSSTPSLQLTGSKRQVVSQQITGLAPETTYYLRLIATNVAGTTESEPISSFRTRPAGPEPEPCANQSLRTEQGSTYLPECRAYEQVSPSDKNFSNADYGWAQSQVAADGEAVAFCNVTGFGEPPGQVTSVCTTYRAARTESGWRTRWMGEPFCRGDVTETKIEGLALSEPEGFSPNLDLAAILHPELTSCPGLTLDPAAPAPQVNLYRSDFRTDPVAHELLNPQPSFGGLHVTAEPGGNYAAASEDFSHLIFTSTGRQTSDAPAGNFEKVFEWHEGALKLVSINPAGKKLTASAAVPDDAVHGVSADGKRIFFLSPATGEGGCASSSCELYMRQDGSATFDVSQSECTSACGESAADEFLAATADGAKALFISEAKLTNEDSAGNGADLYLYTHSANPAADKNLTLLSKDSEPAGGSKAEVLGLFGSSEDAETVYFVANGQLVAGAPTAPGPKLYRWRAGGAGPSLDYLATLSAADTRTWSGSGRAVSRPSVREVSADGRYLIIDSAARIDRGADHDAAVDVYRWSEADGWLCLSCQPPALPSAGASEVPLSQQGGLGGPKIPNIQRNPIGAGGSLVFFLSSDALLPRDTNGRADLYEWHEDGSLSLISSGTDAADVRFLSASRSGQDVFFTSFQRLSGRDTDGNADIYDARVDGGFPEPPAEGAPCEGEACRGAPTSAPPPLGAGSAAFEGSGNLGPKPPRCPRGTRRVRRHGKLRCVKPHHKRRHRGANHNRRLPR